jgi:ABC-type multidrug transport system permease subunit
MTANELPGHLTTLAIFFIVIIGPIWLSLFLQKKYPAKLWLGLFLCFLSPIFGQLYVKKPTLFIAIVLACAIAFYNMHTDTKTIWLSTCVFSAAIMYYRLTSSK